MIEEPKKKKTEDRNGPEIEASASAWKAILTLMVFFSCLSLLVKASTADQAEVQVAYSTDLSLPLWGGSAALTRPLRANMPAYNEVKLHHFDAIPCGNCHETPAATGNSTFPDKNGWKTGVDVNRSCTSLGCHEYDDQMNHPLDVPLPAGLSAGTSQTVTCLSCHRLQQADTDAAQDRELFLQDPAVMGCQSCHARLSGSPQKQLHWKFSKKAHLVSLTPGASTADKTSGEIAYSGPDGVDGESSTCLSCHDEVTVTIPAMNETPQQKADRFRSMTDHPIGMNYQYILSQNPVYFNSLTGSEDRIRMFDGRVGCGSCHSLYSDIPSHLTAEYKGSVLCRTCHNR